MDTINFKEKFETEQANKQLVTAAYQAVFGDLDVTAIDKYFSDTYIQHNPMAEDGKAGLEKFVAFMIQSGVPKSKLDIRRISAEGDLVWVHLKMNFTGNDHSIMDIFRIENGKLAEHWDVLQQIPEKSANNNTMF